jgi:hypothetical protein
MKYTHIRVWNGDELVEESTCEESYSFECQYLVDDPSARINIYAVQDDMKIMWELVPREDAFLEPEFSLYVHELPDDIALFINFTNSHLVTLCHIPATILCKMPHKAFAGVANIVVVNTDGSRDTLCDWLNECPRNICVSSI